MDFISKYKDILKHPLLIFVYHFVFAVLFYFVLTFLGFINNYPNNESVMQWDANWYNSIVQNGYQYTAGEQSNIAFFPGFPYLWRVLHLSPIGISILNLLFYFSGIYILQRALRFSPKFQLLALSLPSVFFCYIPYSEALFFLFGAILIYGLRRDIRWAYLGIFLCCLTRSAAFVFIAVFAIMFVLNVNKKTLKKDLTQYFLFSLSAILGLLFVQVIQYLDTGIFFGLFEAQKQWSRVLNIPTLPLTTVGGANLLWLDGAALVLGGVAISVLIRLLLQKFKNKRKKFPEHILFSISYLSVIILLTMGFTNSGDNASIHSLNRFIFASPFLVVFLYYCSHYSSQIQPQKVFIYLGTVFIVFVLLGLFSYFPALERFEIPILKSKIYFFILFLYVSTYFVITKKSIFNTLFSGLYLFNMLLQIFLLKLFINGYWVG